MSKNPSISLSLIPTKNIFHLTEDMIFDVVLKNISESNLKFPEFPEDRTATTYLFDLEIYRQLGTFDKKVVSVRPSIPALKADLEIAKIILKTGAEKKYKIDLNWWLMQRDTPPPFRDALEAGNYSIKILWRPPTKSWLRELGFSDIDMAHEGPSKKIEIIP